MVAAIGRSYRQVHATALRALGRAPTETFHGRGHWPLLQVGSGFCHLAYSVVLMGQQKVCISQLRGLR